MGGEAIKELRAANSGLTRLRVLRSQYYQQDWLRHVAALPQECLLGLDSPIMFWPAEKHHMYLSSRATVERRYLGLEDLVQLAALNWG